MSSAPSNAKANVSILAIPSSSMVIDRRVDFPVYYKNSTNQYKKLLHPGASLSPKIHKSLQEKSVKKLYIRSADKRKFLSYIQHKEAKSVPTEEEGPKIARAGEVIVKPKPMEIEESPGGFIQKKTEGLEEIPSEKLKADTVVDFTIYYRKSDNSVKKLLEKGNVLTQSMYSLLEMNKVKQVFVRKDEKENFKKYIQNNTPPFTLDEGLPLQQKSREIYRNTSDILENLFKDPKCSWSYARAKTLVEYTVGVIISDKAAIKAFSNEGHVEYDTPSHSFNVAVFAIGFGQHLGLDRNDMVRLGYAGIFHDIGKSQIDPDILDKEGALDDEEFEVVKKHSLYSNFILRSHIERDKTVLDAVKYHHERVDGNGYPDRLKGKEIPTFAQIVSIADAYDAITSKKKYRDQYNSFDALTLMKSEMEGHFDKRLLMEFIKFMGPQYS